mmetsp:Transcript_31559/g.72516  ORF Transcript_31559/g.72516 Transcript_31559/m.72516 type:complete len:201 (-) Transcript_31559:1409-2011(-)
MSVRRVSTAPSNCAPRGEISESSRKNFKCSAPGRHPLGIVTTSSFSVSSSSNTSVPDSGAKSFSTFAVSSTVVYLHSTCPLLPSNRTTVIFTVVSAVADGRATKLGSWKPNVPGSSSLMIDISATFGAPSFTTTLAGRANGGPSSLSSSVDCMVDIIMFSPFGGRASMLASPLADGRRAERAPERRRAERAPELRRETTD